jgi:hypothetical protein
VIQNDPTILSEILYRYYTIAESILENPDDGVPGANLELVREFKKIYGESVLPCRYSPCPSRANCFFSPRDRDRHEASHMRRFKCSESTCEFHNTGFSTKAALQKHNQMYHRKMDEFILPIRRRPQGRNLREEFRSHNVSPNENPQQNKNSNPQLQSNNMPQQPQNGPQRNANGPQPNAFETRMIGEESIRIFNEASAEERNTAWQTMQSRMDPAQWQQYASQTDPVLVFFREQAYEKWRVSAQGQMAQGQQNPAIGLDADSRLLEDSNFPKFFDNPSRLANKDLSPERGIFNEQIKSSEGATILPISKDTPQSFENRRPSPFWDVTLSTSKNTGTQSWVPVENQIQSPFRQVSPLLGQVCSCKNIVSSATRLPCGKCNDLHLISCLATFHGLRVNYCHNCRVRTNTMISNVTDSLLEDYHYLQLTMTKMLRGLIKIEDECVSAISSIGSISKVVTKTSFRR